MAETLPLEIPCGELALEAAAHLPEGGPARGAVVVCHPHPLYGGDMENHVVVSLCRALAGSGLAALRFNFRGTGRSGGRHQEGLGERQDVLAALAAARRLPGVGEGPLGLAGYSFGAAVAAGAAPAAEGLRALALVSPPVQALDGDALASLGLPLLLLAGDRDMFAPAEELRRLSLALGDRCELALLPGVDHFWSLGFEAAAARAVAFFRKHLPGEGP